MDIDWNMIGYHLTQLGIAFVLALPVALNREHQARGAGLRTFPLVSIAACAYMLVGIQVFEGDQAQARIMYAVISGMGFIGGGAIIKNKDNVAGTATAASLWNTGAIGISVALKHYEIAILLAVINFAILQLAAPLKRNDKA